MDLNILKRIKAVQETYLKYKNEDITTKTVYRKYIKDEFFISMRTFYRYLEVNVNRELKRIEDNKQKAAIE